LFPVKTYCDYMEVISGKNILIVGATGGIGAEAAKMLKDSGANLFITGRNAGKLAEVSSKLGIDGSKAFKLDVTQADQVQSVADQIHQQVEQIDTLIIASGIGIIKPTESLTGEDFLQTLHTNVYGPFLIMQAFLPAMKAAKKGLIINMPGVLGKTPMAGAGAYAASKYGLNGLVKSIREELRRTDIRMTNIYLGGVDTPFWDTIDLRVQRNKFIVAKEAARAIWFLCQQPSSGVVSEMVIQPFNHQAI